MVSSSISTPIDAALLKTDFPILNQHFNDGRPPLAFLDTAASSQKPQVVIDALSRYYEEDNANIHRGVYALSERATAAYEATRKHMARFINARKSREIIFTRNTTEAINLVARSWGGANLHEGDLVVFTEMEHHSNIVPWQIIAAEKGARLGFVRITPDGLLDLDSFDELMAQGPKLVAMTQVSNTLGTINPVKELTAKAHEAGAVVVIDAAQSAPHLSIDVQDLDCDFLALSGHKMLGPMGIGVLYGKHELLEAMPPYQGGGSMIRKVTLEKTTWADIPARFEAGTPSVGDAVAFDAALTYLEEVGLEHILEHEHALVALAMERLAAIPGVTVFGPAPEIPRAGVVSFTVDGIHPHDVAAVLDEHNVAVRAGHHCTQPLMRALGVVATTRASFYLYNTDDDVDRLVDAVQAAQRVFA
jgi:cysteine desulfurase/selenocysteine lyase